MNSFVSEETTVSSLNSYSTSWVMNNALINNTNSYGNEDELDENNLCLRLRYVKNEDGTYNNGYAQSVNSFTSISSISFDVRADSGKMGLRVHFVDEESGSLKTTIDIQSLVGQKYNHYDFTTSSLEENKSYFIKFEVYSKGTAKQNNLCIDNLVIVCD